MAMKKFINDPLNLTAELLEGMEIAHGDKIAVQSEKLVVRATPKYESKVALLTLGGAGHEPALSGFVGEGMLDVSVVGDIFAAPGPPKVLEAMRLLKRDAGILFVVLNHAGDVMSDKLPAPGANAPAEDRRGLVGCIPLYKIAGAAAEAGKTLDEVYEIAERFNNQMATLAVAMNSATHPSTGDTLFELADDEMEIGMGQHGEAGTGPTKILSADKTAEVMADRLAAAIDAKKGDKVMVIINGAGATTLMELFIVLRGAKKVLDSKGVSIAASKVGEFLTVQEMAGFQMFIAKMDDELLDFWNAPADSPYMTVC